MVSVIPKIKIIWTNIDIKNDSLYTYNWPGNVRELRNLVERITILSSNETKSDINKIIDTIIDRQQDPKIILATNISSK